MPAGGGPLVGPLGLGYAIQFAGCKCCWIFNNLRPIMSRALPDWVSPSSLSVAALPPSMLTSVAARQMVVLFTTGIISYARAQELVIDASLHASPVVGMFDGHHRRRQKGALRPFPQCTRHDKAQPAPGGLPGHSTLHTHHCSTHLQPLQKAVLTMLVSCPSVTTKSCGSDPTSLSSCCSTLPCVCSSTSPSFQPAVWPIPASAPHTCERNGCRTTNIK